MRFWYHIGPVVGPALGPRFPASASEDRYLLLVATVRPSILRLKRLIASLRAVCELFPHEKPVSCRLNPRNGIWENSGAALLIHAKADDMKSDPAGNAGERMACGVIAKPKDYKTASGR